MTSSSELADIIHEKARHQERRFIVAVAGAPASGKSTLSAELAEQLDNAVVVPMDGFHYDNAILEQRDLLSRKGAPETFDIYGYWNLLIRLRAEEQVAFPIFDRAADLSRASAGIVTRRDRIIIAEGNYLLLNLVPWVIMHQLWDYSLSLNVPLETLKNRLIQRWTDHGLDIAAATERAEHNDLPNARVVLSHSRPADLDLGDPED